MTSPYEVRISTRAARDLDRLPEKVAAACVAFSFGPLSDEPHRVGGHLTRQLAGMRSARRDSYRIIHAVDDEFRRIDMIHIDHRGGVYR